MYKTLKQQIQDLWKSRGLKVLEETVEPLDEGKFKWTIIAEPIKKTPLETLKEANKRTHNLPYKLTSIQIDFLLLIMEGLTSLRSSLNV